MLVELSVMEQRYQAVLAVVQDGWKVTEVAERLGVSRQSVHSWIVRYEAGGLAALADRSHRPSTCPHQTGAEIEARICEMRREHPGWGPRRIEMTAGEQRAATECSAPTHGRLLATSRTHQAGSCASYRAAAGLVPRARPPTALLAARLPEAEAHPGRLGSRT